MQKIYETFSPEETAELGRRFGEAAQPGDVFAITGDLGVGKTVFTKGIAEGLGITEIVNSPTFTILQIYESGRLPLYHFDVYRIAEAEEMEEIGYEDCFYGEGLTLVEWGERIAELLPDGCRRISIEKDPGQGVAYRKIIIAEVSS